MLIHIFGSLFIAYEHGDVPIMISMILLSDLKFVD